MSLAPALVGATTLDLIVLRGQGSVEIFTSSRADSYVDLFALEEAALAEPDGTVDFETLRQGTFDTADEMFTSVRSEVGGAPVQFEAMSMMVHPIADRLPFLTPVDGMVAMAVCTVPTPAVPPTMETLWANTGFIAFTDHASGDIHLTLEAMAVPEVEVSVRYYDLDGFQGRAQFTHHRGDTMVLGTPPGAGLWGLAWLAVAGFASVAGLMTYRIITLAQARTGVAAPSGS